MIKENKNNNSAAIKNLKGKIEYFSDFYKTLGFYKTCALLFKKNGVPNIFFAGIKYPIKIRAGTSDIPTFRDIFIKKEYNLPFNFDPKFIIDAGANAGYTSVFFANKYLEADILAVEPEKSNFNLLMENIAKYSKIKAVQAAIWSKRSFTKICNKEKDDKWAFQVREVKEKDENTISGLTIGDLLKNSQHSEIDILKIDIEGAERHVFSENYDIWLSKTKVICIELHDRLFPGCSNIFFKAVAKHGFKIIQESNNDFILVNENYEL